MLSVCDLYGSHASLYTAKTRACLRFKRIPYQEVLTTKELHDSPLIPRVGRSMIPLVITPDNETLQDSTVIQDTLKAIFPVPAICPQEPKQRLVALLLEAYGKEWLRLPALYCR